MPLYLQHTHFRYCTGNRVLVTFSNLLYIKHISYYATNLILIVMFASWPVYASGNFKNEPDTLICSFATVTKNGEKVWSTYQKMYVKEANKRGLSCLL